MVEGVRAGAALRLVFFVLLVASSLLTSAGEAEWIGYPGDYAIWLGNRLQARRIERGVRLRPFWPAYGFVPAVRFEKRIRLASEEIADVRAHGEVMIEAGTPSGRVEVRGGRALFPAGEYCLRITVFCDSRPPDLFVRGVKVLTDSSWSVVWSRDENPVPAEVVREVRFDVRKTCPVEVRRLGGNRLLADFGREVCGKVRLSGVSRAGTVRVVYGESEMEALDDDELHVDVWERVDVTAGESLFDIPRGFRYVQLIPETAGLAVGAISADLEMLSIPRRGFFRCDDMCLNRIWQVAADTLHLTAREGYVDGIKRDHWVWSGDACQSFLMGYYLFGNNDIVRRTLWMLRGGDPVRMHLNRIMDYTHYWFIAVRDYFLYSGDDTFLRQVYPKMVSLMDFALARLDGDGLPVDRPDDWIFIDWAPEKLHNQGGVTSFETMLLSRALEALSTCARIVGDVRAADDYSVRADGLRKTVVATFWDDSRGGLLHLRRTDGAMDEQFTRYPNLFGLIWDYFDPIRRKRVVEEVLLNDTVMRITTPYMRFYEMEALCRLGRHEEVLGQIRRYWGGMLKLGATSFWEQYDPLQNGVSHYAMYGRPYAKSLCHAWGASPIYLFGRYFLGVKPTSPGFATYEVAPCLGGLKWMEGMVPTPRGDISVRVKDGKVVVSGCEGGGTLIWQGRRTAL